MPVQLASAASRSCTSCTSSGGEWCLPLRRDMKSCFGDVPKQPFYPDLYSDIQGYITCRVIQGGPCTSRDMAGYRFSRWSTFTINQTDLFYFQNKDQQQWLGLWWCCHFTAVGFLQPVAELQALTWSTGSGPRIASLKTAYLWRTWNPLSIQEQSIIQDFNLGIQSWSEVFGSYSE